MVEFTVFSQLAFCCSFLTISTINTNYIRYSFGDKHLKRDTTKRPDGVVYTTMNDFPVIGDLVMRTGLWDRQGANIASRYKEMYGVELFLRLKPVSLDREGRILP